MNFVESILAYYRKSPTKVTFLVSVLFMIILLVTHLIFYQSSEQPVLPEQQNYLSDYIPEDKLLIPITLINGEGLSSLFDFEARVDLFLVHSFNRKKQKLLSDVKLIKTPSESQPFSIILNEIEFKKTENLDQPLFAVLKSKKKTKGIKSSKKNHIFIKIKGEEI